VENGTTTGDEEEDENYDDRIGDAEDRVLDIGHYIKNGVDIDEADHTYVSKTVVVKRHRSWLHKIGLGCLVTKKKKSAFEDMGDHQPL